MSGPEQNCPDEFLTARQLAAILQVSESTVRRLARAGRIPSIQLTARIIRFNLSAVREHLTKTGSRQRAATSRRADEREQLSFVDLL